MNKYVRETLLPEQKIKEQLRKFPTKPEKQEEMSRLKAIAEEASIIVFLFLINKFFIEGSKAASNAVDTFKGLGVDGFYIGKSYFHERNENVVQGYNISKKLLESIEDHEVKELVVSSHSVYEILERYKNRI